jgi:hypothetical protein
MAVTLVIKLSILMLRVMLLVEISAVEGLKSTQEFLMSYTYLFTVYVRVHTECDCPTCNYSLITLVTRK